MWSDGCMVLTGENTSACPCGTLYIDPHLQWPGVEPDSQRWEAGN
jgi:hypothetical protein